MTDRAAPAGDVPAIEEIEITPEMIEAGMEIFLDYDPRFERPKTLVQDIYRAMFLVAPR